MFALPALEPPRKGLSSAELRQLRIHLAGNGLPPIDDRGVEERLLGLRQMYEPCILALSRYLSLDLPTWLPGQQSADNWQASVRDSLSVVGWKFDETAALPRGGYPE